MAHTLTETTTYDASVTVPDAGDSRTAASVNVGFQALANRAKYLKAHVDALEADTLDARLDVLEGRFENGLFIGPGNARSSDLTHIVVESYVSLDVGSHHFGENNAVTVLPTLLANSTWHYLYAFNNSGSIDFVATTTAPAGNQRYMGGDATKVFICSFYVDGSAQIRPFAKRGKVYTWRRSLIPGNDLLVTGGSFTDAGPSARNLNTLISPISTMAKCELSAYNTLDNLVAVLRVYSGTDSGAGHTSVSSKFLTNVTATLQADIETDSSRQVSTEVAGSTAGGAVPTATLAVIGYVE